MLFITACVCNKTHRIPWYQHAIIGPRLAGEEGKHDAKVGVLQLQSQRAAHLPPQRRLLIGVARQRHGNHIQVQVTCENQEVQQEFLFNVF